VATPHEPPAGGAGSPGSPVPPGPPGTSPAARVAVTVVVDASLTRDGIPALCDRLRERLAAAPGTTVVACDVRTVDHPDAVVLDTLARLQLTARRAGSELRLLGAGASLRAMLGVIGFDVTLGLVELSGDDLPAPSVEVGRQPEQREEALGVEEGVEADDPVA
jgi:anti-anti-sigma regulatory factor